MLVKATKKVEYICMSVMFPFKPDHVMFEYRSVELVLCKKSNSRSIAILIFSL